MATAITATSGSAKKVVVKKRRKRKKKGKNYYFNQGTEKAIIRYNNTDDPRLKNYAGDLASDYYFENRKGREKWYKEVMKSHDAMREDAAALFLYYLLYKSRC